MPSEVFVVFESTLIQVDGAINESKVRGVYATRAAAERARDAVMAELDARFKGHEDDFDDNCPPEYSVEVLEMEVQ